MTELPSDAFTDAPAGTPHAERSTVADVWCTHGVRWTHETAGYLPVERDAAHPASRAWTPGRSRASASR